MRAETLANTAAMLAWIVDAVAAGAVDDSPFTRDRIMALAVRCRERGHNGGGGLFTTLMRRGNFDHANQDDFDAAIAEIAAHERGQPGTSLAAEFLADFGTLPGPDRPTE